MAEISPFKGICYNQHRIGNLADVMTPPYDVISPAQQQAFYDRHPNNVVRLDFAKTSDADSTENNRYTRAAADFDRWRTEGILVRSEAPALYLTAIDYTVNGNACRRFGLIAKVGLEPFDKKIIRPHERTFSKVKTERLELMKACRANFSPIFGIYTDTGDILQRLKQAVAGKPTESDILDDAGHRHRMWHIADPDLHRYVRDAFADKQVFIADGHHRYETALNFRNWLSETEPGFDSHHPANGVMMYLCSMNDPGLTVLPAHRLLMGVSPTVRERLPQEAAAFFDVTAFPADKEGQAALLSALHADAPGTRLGLFMKEHSRAFLLTLKAGVMDRLFGNEIPDVLRHLDVTVLTRLVFMTLLGFDEMRLDNESSIAYTSEDPQAIAQVFEGRCDMAFLMNPTGIAQVQAVAEQDLTMPRKSTYFYPKVITGQVLNSLT